MKRPGTSRLVRLERAVGDAKRVLVLTHDNPDPDALSSAWALRALLNRKRRRIVDVAYGGMIGRAQNRAMVAVLGFPLKRIEALSVDRYDRVALVDSQPETGNNSLPEERTPEIVIDHHPLRQETRAAAYFDVRPAYGATATILGEYMDAAELIPTRRLATALLFGVKSETLDLSREAGARDVALYHALIARADRQALARIENAPLAPDHLDWLRRAIDGTVITGKVAISRLGALDYPDRVAEFADLAIRVSGLEWAVVLGRFERAIFVSIRTSRGRGAGQMVRRIVGSLGKAGGHGSMAAGKIPVPEGSDAVSLETVVAERATALLG